jgi:nucleotide-binding universal stress UspA family protein
MHKILVAIDGSKSSLRAIDYAGKHWGGAGQVQVTLLHVLPGVPAEFWDDGHILSKEEKADRKKVVKKWAANQKTGQGALFQKAKAALEKHGLKARQVKARSVPEDPDVADAILGETEAGGYDTLVLGRRGRSAVARFVMGSVASKVVNHAQKVAVVVVE